MSVARTGGGDLFVAREVGEEGEEWEARFLGLKFGGRFALVLSFPEGRGRTVIPFGWANCCDAPMLRRLEKVERRRSWLGGLGDEEDEECDQVFTAPTTSPTASWSTLPKLERRR